MSDDRMHCPHWRPMHQVFAADPLAVRAAVVMLVANLPPRYKTQEARSSVEIALSEALNNIVEHAYPEGSGYITLWLDEGQDGLICEIRDQGAPMPGGVLPEGRLPAQDRPDLPEGGFGWFMIRALTRDLQYSRQGETNRLRFVLPRPQCNDPATIVDTMAPMPR